MRIPAYSADSLARVFKALGDETRLRIVHLLARRGELCVCDVESILEISQSKASRHLGYLKNASLVEDRRDGTWVYYRLVRDAAVIRESVRAIERALEGDPRAQRDLDAAETSARSPSCAPIEAARRA